MKSTQIKIFTEGDNRFAEKVNPFESKIGMFPIQYDNPEFIEFEDGNFTKMPYLGNKTDGVYDTELFKEIQQYLHGLTKWQTRDYRDNFPYTKTRQALADKSEVKEAETVDVVQSVLDYLHRNITASVVYEDFYDFSKGINGATVDYFPETSNELFLEMGLSIRTPIQSETMINDLKAMVEERNVKIKKLIDASMAVILDYKPNADGFTILPNRLIKGLADAVKGDKEEGYVTTVKMGKPLKF